MKNFLIKLTTVISIFSWLFMTAPVAHADVNDFTITNFDAIYTLSSEDPQGLLKIHEEISVNFTDNNHGILRAIPKTYKDKTVNLKILNVSSKTGTPSQYTTYTQNDNLVVKIGDPNKTITGKQQYSIDYTASNVITFYNDHDELYWDINGDQWGQPFLFVKAKFIFPKEVNVSKVDCFTGIFGAKFDNCKIIKTSQNMVSLSTTKTLNPRESSTAVVAFNKGVFRPANFSDWFSDNQSKLLGVAVPPLFVGLWAYQRWRRKGKDLKGRGVIVPEYDPPDKLTPGEVGLIADYKLDNKDISATIIDLAIRKYLKIIETKTGLLKRGKKYELELLKTTVVGLKTHEKTILSGIFTKFSVGNVVELADLKNSFYKTVSNVRKDLNKDLTEQGYFEANPLNAGKGMLAGAVGAVILAFIIHVWLSLGLIISAGILFIFANLMDRRSANGVKAKEHVEGLKMYLEVAEKDRIKMMQSPDSPYAKKSLEPKRTVELYEKLLPYAILLGVEKQWSKKFEDIYKQAPDWYSGNWSTFNTAVFASSLSSGVGAMSSNFSAPSSSGSSGSGGGGFSGGGGGGGGGGGW